MSSSIYQAGRARHQASEASDTALAWLRLLYPGEPTGHLVLWTRQDRRSHWFSAVNVEGASTAAAGLARHHDVYCGVGLHPRQLGEGERGRGGGVCAIPGLWLDLDVAGPAHQGEDLPPDRTAAYKVVEEFALPPTAVVDSGHGLQVWWLFDELWRFASPEEHERAAELSKRFQATLTGIGRRLGWHVDSTHDLARVLRVPGTLNRKLEPVPVYVVEAHDRRYRPEDFEGHLVAAVEVRGPAPAVEGEIANQHRNTTLTSLGGTMRRRGMSRDAIAAGLLAENDQRCNPPLPEHEVRAIAASVAAYAPVASPVARNGNGEEPLPEMPSDYHDDERPASRRTNDTRRASETEAQEDRDLLRARVRIGATRSLVSGDSFVLDTPEVVEAVWGDDSAIAWPKGEYLLGNGPTGVGKSTLIQQVVVARLGLRGGRVIGMAVEPDDRAVLYLAIDRPSQIARSFQRMVSESDRALLQERLKVWRGPLPASIVSEPEMLGVMAEEVGAGMVIVDSLKDLAPKLSDEEVGQRIKEALTAPCLEGIEVSALHHQRKKQQGGGKPTSIDDVYGSTFITAGAGSVLLLWGEPGDAVVELSHLKQPGEAVGPLTLFHDHATGITTVCDQVDLLDVVRTSNGLNAEGAARAIFASASPTRNEVEKARYKLDRLVAKGLVHPELGGRSVTGKQLPTRYYLVDNRPS